MLLLVFESKEGMLKNTEFDIGIDEKVVIKNASVEIIFEFFNF